MFGIGARYMMSDRLLPLARQEPIAHHVARPNTEHLPKPGGSMNCLVLGLAVLGLASLGATAEARAQGTRFGLGGGLAAPTGDYGSVDKGGWHALAKVDFAIPM